MALKRLAAVAGLILCAAAVVSAALAGVAVDFDPAQSSAAELLALSGLVLMTFRLHWDARKMKRS